MEIRVPSEAGTRQAMTILPRWSCSSLNCLTAHCRHAPTEPNAGCQQKYGKFMPRERQPWSRFCFSFIWYGWLSTYTVAISTPRAPLFSNVPLEILAEIFQRALQRLGRTGSEHTKRMSRRKEFRLCREPFQIARLTFSFLHCFQEAFH